MNHAIANSVSGGDAEGAYEVWVELHPCIQKLRVSRYAGSDCIGFCHEYAMTCGYCPGW